MPIYLEAVDAGATKYAFSETWPGYLEERAALYRAQNQEPPPLDERDVSVPIVGFIEYFPESAEQTPLTSTEEDDDGKEIEVEIGTQQTSMPSHFAIWRTPSGLLVLMMLEIQLSQIDPAQHPPQLVENEKKLREIMLGGQTQERAIRRRLWQQQGPITHDDEYWDLQSAYDELLPKLKEVHLGPEEEPEEPEEPEQVAPTPAQPQLVAPQGGNGGATPPNPS